MNAERSPFVGIPLAKNRNSGYIDPNAETKNSIPATNRDFFLPRPVESHPEMALPIMQPMRAAAQVNPCRASVY